MNVIKKDGSVEELDVRKIRKHTKFAVEGFEDESADKLEIESKIHFFDGIHTETIQETLIATAVSNIDVDRPNATFVAARLFIYDMYHTYIRNVGGLGFKKYIERGVKENRLNPALLEFDLDKYDSIIEIPNGKIMENDYLFTYSAIVNFCHKVLKKDRDGNLIELPQYAMLANSMVLHLEEKDHFNTTKRHYEMISKHKAMTSTPTLSNARGTRPQLSSCYIGATGDNIESINYTNSDISLLSKFGGGIGWDWHDVRGAHSSIDGYHDVAGGIVPFLKIVNAIANAVDQLGTRKGAVAVYIEPWHIDTLLFIEAKKTATEERLAVRDLFLAFWTNDLFLDRVKENGIWSLMDPYDVPDLHTLYGEDFKRAYEAYEQDDSIKKEVISARGLMEEIVSLWYTTGSPFIVMKDEANRRHQCENIGVIRSSNLCVEILNATSPGKLVTNIHLDNGNVMTLDENSMITTDSGLVKKITKLNQTDYIDGVKVNYITNSVKDRKISVCNLTSINLGKLDNLDDLEELVNISIRALDNVIDINFYPVGAARDTNIENRSIGLGVMGEHHFLAKRKIKYGSQEHLELIDELYERFSYYAIKASIELAEEKGAYPAFEGSNWHKGILPIDTQNENAKRLTKREYCMDWDSLRERAKQGIRNGYIMAIAPTSTISVHTSTTSTIEPIYKKVFIEANGAGNNKVIAPDLSADTWEYYESAHEIDQKSIISAAAIRQKWIDQSQSLNLFAKSGEIDGVDIVNWIMHGYEHGIKSFYYLRSFSPKELSDDQGNENIICDSCQ